MPHAVIIGARECPRLVGRPLAMEDGVVFKVAEMARGDAGWLLKCLIAHKGGEPRHFFARVDERDDGLVVHMDDHMPTPRDDELFRFLALVAQRVLDATPGSTLGKTNLEKWLKPAEHAHPPA